jgi:hypothetical protein
MQPKELLFPILSDEALTRGLGDPEARILVEWLVECADSYCGETAADEIKRLCRWARGVSRFVFLWCYQHSPGSATQLAAAEGFKWPLPETWLDPCELMEHILTWENPGSRVAATLNKR